MLIIEAIWGVLFFSLFLIFFAVKACRRLKWKGGERRLARLSLWVATLVIFGPPARVVVYLCARYDILPRSFGFFFSGLALSTATTWLFLKLVPKRQPEFLPTK